MPMKQPPMTIFEIAIEMLFSASEPCGGVSCVVYCSTMRRLNTNSNSRGAPAGAPRRLSARTQRRDQSRRALGKLTTSLARF